MQLCIIGNLFMPVSPCLSAQPKFNGFQSQRICRTIGSLRLFECVGRSYGSTIEKGRPEPYPISILEKTECTNILWDSMSISK